MKNVFLPAKILLPQNADMQKWSTIACDQFSSQPEYWHKAEEIIKDAPSTLRLMLPEAYLETIDVKASTEKINKTMKDYLLGDLFKAEDDAMIYVEREISDGRIRKGIVGVIDLDEYDYSSDSSSLIRASEETVVSRLPARIELRTGACIEMPHTMVLIDDPDYTVIEPLSSKSNKDKLYDFELMQGGGKIIGYKLSADDIKGVQENIAGLLDDDKYTARYRTEIKGNPVLCVVGDGNHSLAAAKACWESKKATLSKAELENDPARFSLVEIVNIHDASLDFAPIHRIVFDVEAEKLLAELKATISQDIEKSEIVAVFAGGSERIKMPTDDTGEIVRILQNFLDKYTAEHGGKIDYIHGDDALVSLITGDREIGFLLPELSKSGLFKSVISNGALPRKSFSMGQARDKRYYLECRKIM